MARETMAVNYGSACTVLHACIVLLRFTVEVLTIGNPTRARILTTQVLDREEVNTYRLTLVGRDTSSFPVSSSVTVTISLCDLNDDAPVFDQPSWVFDLNENINSALIMNFNVRIKKLMLFVTSKAMLLLFSFQVTDRDLGTNANLDYSIDPSADGLFALVASGTNIVSLFLTRSLDRETRTSYSFRITAMDRGQPTLSGQTQVIINVSVSQYL